MFPRRWLDKITLRSWSFLLFVDSLSSRAHSLQTDSHPWGMRGVNWALPFISQALPDTDTIALLSLLIQTGAGHWDKRGAQMKAAIPADQPALPSALQTWTQARCTVSALMVGKSSFHFTQQVPARDADVALCPAILRHCPALCRCQALCRADWEASPGCGQGRALKHSVGEQGAGRSRNLSLQSGDGWDERKNESGSCAVIFIPNRCRGDPSLGMLLAVCLQQHPCWVLTALVINYFPGFTAEPIAHN